MVGQGLRINRNGGNSTRKGKLAWLTLATMTTLWLGLVGVGMSWIWRYQATPGLTSPTPQIWPTESQFERNSSRPQLILFAHPRCPCTRATIGELAMIMARCEDRVDARVVFFKPASVADSWKMTNLRSAAESIPGVVVGDDPEGVEAKRFRIATSGHTVVYDSQGRLRFSGGITGSRGHSGDNLGRSAVESLLLKGLNEQRQTAVFGCPLLGRATPGPNIPGKESPACE